jgi:pimeloyl-ACP methyl ester carboxylesterase
MQIIVDGLHTVVHSYGSGPVILLLHGWGVDSSTYDNLIQHFPEHQVVTIDLPGFGGTQAPQSVWDVHDYASFVRDVVQKLEEIEQISVIVGHSFGGRVALDGVGSGLLEAEQLILLASHGLPEQVTSKEALKQQLVQLGSRLLRLLPKGLSSRIRSWSIKRFGSDDYLASGQLEATFKKVIAQDVTNLAPLITIPTLLIYGSADATTPPELGKRISDLIPNAQLHIVEGAGHYVYVDAPSEVIETMREFIT